MNIGEILNKNRQLFHVFGSFFKKIPQLRLNNIKWKTEKMDKNNIQVNLSVIDIEKKYVYDADEVISSTKGPVNWGKDNKYSSFLKNLYYNSATLSSIINGSVNYVLGNGVEATEKAAKWNDTVNRRGDTLYDIVNSLASDYFIYKGFAIQVIYSKLGTVAEIYALDFNKCRSDEHHKKIYFNKKGWSSYSSKYDVYDAYGAKYNPDKPTQILYFTDGSRGVYPHTKWEGAINDVLTEIECSRYSLNSIGNGLSARYILTIPSSSNLTKEQKEIIEKGIKEKFTGTDSPSNFALYFATGTEEMKVNAITADEQNEKFVEIKKASRQNIFTAFCAVPALFGLMNESTGFNEQEFKSAYKLYYETQIKPLQIKINKQISKILGVEQALVFKPLVINWED